jgi:hypothetical protein
LNNSVHFYHLLDRIGARKIKKFSQNARNPVNFLLDRLQMPIGQVILLGLIPQNAYGSLDNR